MRGFFDMGLFDIVPLKLEPFNMGPSNMGPPNIGPSHASNYAINSFFSCFPVLHTILDRWP